MLWGDIRWLRSTMSTEESTIPKKTLGTAIDEIISALQGLDSASRASAIRTVCEHLVISVPQTIARTEVASSTTQGGQPFVETDLPTDIRGLKDKKQPKTVMEMAALVAFYLQEFSDEKRDQVDVNDMKKYFKQAQFPTTSYRNILFNAKNAGYFELLGNGKFRLNPVGYNLVAYNLPRGNGTSIAAGRARKNGKIKRTSRKKR